jgi:uncharacterized protein (TIGR02246 family)
MKTQTAALLILACATASLSPLHAQPEPEPKPMDEALKIATGLTETYIAAFKKADVAALSSMYSEDVVYTSEDGSVTRGREALAAGLKKFFAANPGAEMAVAIETARFLGTSVLVEEGIADVAGQTTQYRCVYLKEGDTWLIAEIEETALPAADEAALALAELAPLVGTWKDNSPGTSVETRVSYTKNDRFLRRSFTVKRGDAPEIEGTEVIGYDPVAGQIRSWIFDSEGGFGEGYWKREGNKWMITATATAPDGTLSSAHHVITLLNPNKLTWESTNRVADGQALPNLDKVEVVRIGNP